MKRTLLWIPALGFLFSGCSGIQETFRALEENRQAVNASTQAIWDNQMAVQEANRSIAANRQAIDASSQAIWENGQAVREANRSIAENRRHLEEINQSLQKASEE